MAMNYWVCFSAIVSLIALQQWLPCSAEVVSVSCNSDMICPYQALTYTCTVQSTWIKWGYKKGNDFNGVLLGSSQSIGHVISDYGLKMTLINKTDTTVLTATVDFSVTSNLNNTYMLCDDALFGDPELDDGCYISLSSFDPPKPPVVSYHKLSDTSIRLDWTPSADDTNSHCIESYEVTLNGEVYQTTSNTSIVITGLAANQNHSLGVIALDHANNKSNVAQIYYVYSATASASVSNPLYPSPTTTSSQTNITASGVSDGSSSQSSSQSSVQQFHTSFTTYIVSTPAITGHPLPSSTNNEPECPISVWVYTTSTHLIIIALIVCLVLVNLFILGFLVVSLLKLNRMKLKEIG